MIMNDERNKTQYKAKWVLECEDVQHNLFTKLESKHKGNINA